MAKRLEWHLEKRKLSELKPYDKNPRLITEKGLRDLKNSFDEIGIAQPININIDNTILSGHARWEQMKLDGVKEVDVYVPERTLTPKEEEAVIVRMNKNIAGQWNYDILANQFDMDDLKNWGFTEADLVMTGVNDVDEEWTGMPEFDQSDKTSFRHIVVHFMNDKDTKKFFKLIDQKDTGETRSIWFPPQKNMETNSKRYGDE